jgi:hypothetical protein
MSCGERRDWFEDARNAWIVLALNYKKRPLHEVHCGQKEEFISG